MATSQKQTEIQQQIYQLTTLVAGDFSLQEVLEKLTEAAVEITSVRACSIRLLDEQTGELKMQSTLGLSDEYRNKGIVTREDPVIKAAFAGEAVVLDDMRIDDRVKYRHTTIKEGLVSQLTVAMNFRKKPIGVLRLYSPSPKHFDQDDVKLARSVASQCAVAITNARLYAREIENARMAEQIKLAATIQRRMIPEKAPKIKNLDIAAMYIPCFEVGGDLYDFYQISETCFIIAIADVIGKGMAAAMMMSMFRGAVRAYTDADGMKSNIEQIATRLNRLACLECKTGEFITLFYGVINSEKNTISYCNCGHEPPLLLRQNSMEELTAGGLVLGVLPDAEYQTGTAKLNSRDCLLFYTDGLTDATSFDGQLWGRERMLSAVRSSVDKPAETMIKDILGYRRRFVGLADQTDDTSIVAVKVTVGKKIN